MVIGIFGENCSGKSTLADALRGALGGTLYTGKDYLRMAKSPAEAEKRFCALLQDALHDGNVFYVISEKQLLRFLPEGAFQILVKADLPTVKARFRERMRGNLPVPVEMMLERNHGAFDAEPFDFCFDSASGDAARQTEQLINKLSEVQNDAQN